MPNLRHPPVRQDAIRIGDLPYSQYAVDETANGRQVMHHLELHTAVPGVLILRHTTEAARPRLLGMVSRQRFFEQVGRPYGVEVYLNRPVAAMLEKSREETLILSSSTGIPDAVNQALNRDPGRLYEPIVVHTVSGQYRMLDMHDLLLAQSGLLSQTNLRLEKVNKALEEARQIAEQADKLKSQFLAHMSHELRTPLNAILNFTAFVADGLMGEVNLEQVESLTRVTDSANHLLSLINDVLDISKIEAGLMTLFVEEVNLNEALRVTVSMAKGLLKDKPLVFEADIGLGLPICKHFVESHGGKLSVESQPGRGSAFSVLLPVENPEIKPVF